MDPLAAPESSAGERFFDEARLLAIAGAVKEAKSNEAKCRLPDGFTRTITVKALIRATITKGQSTPGTQGKRPGTCELRTAAMISEVLRLLEVPPARAKALFKRAAKDGGHLMNYDVRPANAAILTAINEAQAEIAAELPAVTYVSSGKRGEVNVRDVSIEYLA